MDIEKEEEKETTKKKEREQAEGKQLKKKGRDCWRRRHRIRKRRGILKYRILGSPSSLLHTAFLA
jgi:hypothetical protein